jgi:chromosome segregation protein
MQMLFADASTGAVPALVRQGQIAELVNSNPKPVVESSKSGGYFLLITPPRGRLKLKRSEQNLRVDDVIERLATQLGARPQVFRQAARYRAIGDELRQSEGLLLYRC